MIYDYKVTTGKGEELDLSTFRGKVVLVVNTATGCGFTPQYAPIEKLYKDYHEKGFEGFEEHEYKALLEKMFAEKDPDGDKNPDIKWNFTKFVIDRDGNVVARFEPTADMSKVEDCIKRLL